MPYRTIDGTKVKVTADEAARIDMLRKVGAQKPKTDEEHAALDTLRDEAIAEAKCLGVDKLTLDEPGQLRVTVFKGATKHWQDLDLDAAREASPELFGDLFTERTVWTPTDALDNFLRSDYAEGSRHHNMQAALVAAKRAQTAWSWRVSKPREVVCPHCRTKGNPVKGCPVNLCVKCQPLYNMQALTWEVGKGELRPSTFNNLRAKCVRRELLLPETEVADDA